MTNTEQKWFARVTAWRSSGLSAREFSMGQDFTAGGLSHWAHQLRKRGIATSTAPVASATLVRLARVERGQAATAPSALTIEIGAARLSVPPGFDEGTARAVIGALLDGTTRSAR